MLQRNYTFVTLFSSINVRWNYIEKEFYTYIYYIEKLHQIFKYFYIEKMYELREYLRDNKIR